MALEAVGWIKMPLGSGTEVGLGPGHAVRSTPPSRPNHIRGGLKCPSVGIRPSVRPSVHNKIFFPISMKFGMLIQADDCI